MGQLPHKREPMVLVHTVAGSQLPKLVAHSLISTHVVPMSVAVVVKPDGHLAHEREPAVFVQFTNGSHPPFEVRHSLISTVTKSRNNSTIDQQVLIWFIWRFTNTRGIASSGVASWTHAART
jgi:hypothetical protein